jgi:hypothetical protein
VNAVSVSSLWNLADEGVYNPAGHFTQPTVLTIGGEATHKHQAVSYYEINRDDFIRDKALMNALDVSDDDIVSPMSIYIPAHSSGKLRVLFPNGEPNSGDFMVESGVVNQYGSLIDVYLSFAANHEVLLYSGMQIQIPQWRTAVIGQRCVAKEHGSQKVVDEFVVKGNSLFVVRHKNNPEMVCDLDDCDAMAWNDIRTTPLSEIWAEGNSTERGRKSDNRRHPKKLPHFTKVGFEKRAIPEKTWEILSTYWRHNRNNYVIEKWTPGSSFVNHRVHPTFMSWLPEQGNLKQQIFDDILPHLESWSGLKLTPTSFYGIRLYSRGSRLENHVDRASMLVISIIFNIDQEVEEDWPLEIYDHAGRVHQVVLKPGEMVFYESATCVHGRPTPLNGRYFANAFIHYKPVDKTKWPFETDSL